MESKKKPYSLNMHIYGSTSLIINTLMTYIDVSTRCGKKRTYVMWRITIYNYIIQKNHMPQYK